MLEDYTTGTVSISNGSATLTGTGTAWKTAGLKAGDTFYKDGYAILISAVGDEDAITLAAAWPGASLSGASYAIRFQPDNSRMQGTTRQVLDQLRQGIWLTPDATGKTADKADYDDRSKGFRFLDVSVDPFKLYVKESDTSADWSSGADWVGPAGETGPAGADGNISYAIGAMALASLNGEDGLAVDFDARSAAVRDSVGSTTFLGKPGDLLTLTRSSAATYCNGGILKLAAANAMRFDRDPITDVPRGVLLEPSSTNYALQSEDFSVSGSWTNSNILAFGSGSTVNATTAPDGAMTADKLVPNTTSGAHNAFGASISLTANGAFTLSIWLKPAGYSKALLRLMAAGGDIRANFDLAHGSFDTVSNIGTASGAQARMEKWANGWWRCSISGIPASSGSSVNAYIAVLDDTGALVFSGDGTSGMYMWGAQVEEGGTRPTSYIKTATLPATRSSDRLNISTDVFPFNASEGYLRVKATLGDVLTTSYLAQLSDGTTSNLILLQAASSEGQGYVTNGGVSQAAMSGNPAHAGEDIDLAIGWKADDIALAQAGTLVATDAAGTIPGDLTDFDIGCPGSEGTAEVIHIHQIVYKPRKPKNSEMAAVSPSNVITYDVADLPDPAPAANRLIRVNDNGFKTMAISIGTSWEPAYSGALPSWLQDNVALDLDFTKQRYWGGKDRGYLRLDKHLTIGRASPGTALTAAGALVQFDPNIMRVTDKGLLCEGAAKNLVINSLSPATQTVTVVSGTTYTVSMLGSGSVVLSGAGTGTVSAGSSVTLTASSTSLTLTVSGTVTAMQCEAATYSSSFIATGLYATSRAIDNIWLDLNKMPELIGLDEMTVLNWFEVTQEMANDVTGTFSEISDGTLNNAYTANYRVHDSPPYDPPADTNMGLTVITAGNMVGYDPTTQTQQGVVQCFGYTLKASTKTFAVSSDGSAIAGGTDTAWPTIANLTRLQLGGRVNGSVSLHGYLRRLAIIPTYLPDDLPTLTDLQY